MSPFTNCVFFEMIHQSGKILLPAYRLKTCALQGIHPPRQYYVPAAAVCGLRP